MKRTEIAPPTDLPRSLLPYLEGARVFNPSCSREATVYYLEGRPTQQPQHSADIFSI